MALNLSDVFRLTRAGIYTNPLNSADKLPLPYGDLTDGTNGNWILPCIDTVNHVYAYAGFDVLSTGEGNSVTTYVDGVQTASTFNNANDYESQGLIATCTFASTQGNKEVSARGKGRDDAGTLIENLIDQVVDFIDNVVGETSTDELDDTFKALATAIFTAQGYKSAGVIVDDITYWTLFQQMAYSFYGKVYRNNNKKLVFLLDDGTLNQYAQVNRFKQGDLTVLKAKRTEEDIINRCPMKYSYSYVANIYKEETNTDAHVNTASETRYGSRLPRTGFFALPWCRDLTSAQTVQDLIIADYAKPIWTFTIQDNTYQFIHADMFNIFSTTIPWVYCDEGTALINQLFKLIEKTVDTTNNILTLQAKDTGVYLTTTILADGSAIADGTYKAGNDRDTTQY